jgi:hypothetical protein
MRAIAFFIPSTAHSFRYFQYEKSSSGRRQVVVVASELLGGVREHWPVGGETEAVNRAVCMGTSHSVHRGSRTAVSEICRSALQPGRHGCSAAQTQLETIHYSGWNTMLGWEGSPLEALFSRPHTAAFAVAEVRLEQRDTKGRIKAL